MSWKHLTANVPLYQDCDLDDEILGWERDDTWSDPSDECSDDTEVDLTDECDGDKEGRGLVMPDDLGALMGPDEIERDKLYKEIKSETSRQDISHLIALYRRSASRDDLIDVYWISKCDMPYYLPEGYYLKSNEELLKEVNPVPFEEMGLFVEFVERLQAVFELVRDAILETSGDRWATFFSTECKPELSGADISTRNDILLRVVIEGEKAILADV